MGFRRHAELSPLHLEQPLILLHQCVLGLGQNKLERGLVEILKRRDDWKAADEFRDQAVFEQILGFDFAEDLALLSILGRDDLGTVTDRARSAARRNDLLEASERTATDEQDICGIDLQEFLLRVFAAALRWHTRDLSRSGRSGGYSTSLAPPKIGPILHLRFRLETCFVRDTIASKRSGPTFAIGKSQRTQIWITIAFG